MILEKLEYSFYKRNVISYSYNTLDEYSITIIGNRYTSITLPPTKKGPTPPCKIEIIFSDLINENWKKKKRKAKKKSKKNLKKKKN